MKLDKEVVLNLLLNLGDVLNLVLSLMVAFVLFLGELADHGLSSDFRLMKVKLGLDFDSVHCDIF